MYTIDLFLILVASTLIVNTLVLPQAFSMSIQRDLEGWTLWDYNPPMFRPIWGEIGGRGGELDISIHRAAAQGDVAELARLLDAGYNINARCAMGNCAIYCASKTIPALIY